MLGVKADLKWSRNQDGLMIKAPKEKPCEYAYVFKIILEK
jgi:alpha-L-fucosidase